MECSITFTLYCKIADRIYATPFMLCSHYYYYQRVWQSLPRKKQEHNFHSFMNLIRRKHSNELNALDVIKTK